MTGRLIDADVLKQDLTRFYDNEVTAKQLIDEQPTVDSIPIDFIVERIENENAEIEGRDVLVELYLEWRHECGNFDEDDRFNDLPPLAERKEK